MSQMSNNSQWLENDEMRLTLTKGFLQLKQQRSTVRNNEADGHGTHCNWMLHTREQDRCRKLYWRSGKMQVSPPIATDQMLGRAPQPGAGCTKVLAVTLANGDQIHHDGRSGKLWVLLFNQKKQWYEEVKANEFKS